MYAYREEKEKQNIYIMCQVSNVMCYVSDVNCHMSLTPTATATNPPPANSPIMHSRLVRKDPKIGTNFKRQKIIETTKTQKWLYAL